MNHALDSDYKAVLVKSENDSFENDYIMYSDSDEIPNPKTIKNMNLNKKYGRF